MTENNSPLTPIRFAINFGSDELLTCACGLGADGMGDTTFVPARKNLMGTWWICDWDAVNEVELQPTHYLCLVCGLTVPIVHDEVLLFSDTAHSRLMTGAQRVWISAQSKFISEQGLAMHVLPAYEYATEWCIPVHLDEDDKPVWFFNPMTWPYKYSDPRAAGEYQFRPYQPQSTSPFDAYGENPNLFPKDK